MAPLKTQLHDDVITAAHEIVPLLRDLISNLFVSIWLMGSVGVTFALVVLFRGEPDLLQAIVQFLLDHAK